MYQAFVIIVILAIRSVVNSVLEDREKETIPPLQDSIVSFFAAYL